MNRKNIVLAGLFAALIFAATTYLPRIPTTGGYVHIGDVFIYLGASIMPLPYALAAAAIGGSMSDLLSGYGQWVPFTFVIKALLVLPFTCKREKLFCVRNAFAIFAALFITVGGYYLAGSALFGNFAAPLAEVPANILQAAASAVFYVVIALGFDRAGLKRRLLSGK